MPWPQPTDYNAAMQNPALSLTDPELRQAQVTTGVHLELFNLDRQLMTDSMQPSVSLPLRGRVGEGVPG